jgi:hypothetical protein
MPSPSAYGDAILIADPSLNGGAIAAGLRALRLIVVEVTPELLASRALAESPRAILLDVDLPGALDAAERARELLSSAPPEIFCLGDLLRAAELGATRASGRAFGRPIDVNAVIAAVAGVVAPFSSGERSPPSFGPFRPTLPPRPSESEPPPPVSELPSSGESMEVLPPSLGAPQSQLFPNELSPELQRILGAAEERVATQNRPSSAPSFPSPDDELDMLLPPELLAALDEPLDPEEEGSGTGSGGGSTSAVRHPTGASGSHVSAVDKTASGEGTARRSLGSEPGHEGRTPVSAMYVEGRTPVSAMYVEGRTPVSAMHVEGRTPVSAMHVEGRASSSSAVTEPRAMVSVAAAEVGRATSPAVSAPLSSDALDARGPTTPTLQAAAPSLLLDEPRRPEPPPLPRRRAITPAPSSALVATPFFGAASSPSREGREGREARDTGALDSPISPLLPTVPASLPRTPVAPLIRDGGLPLRAPSPAIDGGAASRSLPPSLLALPTLTDVVFADRRGFGITPVSGIEAVTTRAAASPAGSDVALREHPSAVSPPVALGEGDVIAALARAVATRATGALTLGAEPDLRRVVLHDGDIVTAASSAPEETLVAFLTARGDLPREVSARLASRLPPQGRHAGAALIAHGHLGQDDLWPVLRAHAEWLIGRAIVSDMGTWELDPEPPGRLKAEPNVFGGATGAEVLVEQIRRVVPPDVALRRLGGAGARLAEGPRAMLIAECALRRDEEALARGAPGRSVAEILRGAEPEIANVLYALVALGALTALASPAPAPTKPEEGADPLDAEAIRQRVRARLDLVEDGDYFALLGVSPAATGYEIRRAYLDLRRSFEPSRVLTAQTADLAPDMRLIAEVLDEAYDILRDPHRRDRYRKAIEAGPP